MVRRPQTENLKEKAMEMTEALKPNDSQSDLLDFTPFSGNMGILVSTGSTLLDLDISGGRIEQGGIPSGILIEVFGDSGSPHKSFSKLLNGFVIYRNVKSNALCVECLL